MFCLLHHDLLAASVSAALKNKTEGFYLQLGFREVACSESAVLGSSSDVYQSMREKPAQPSPASFTWLVGFSDRGNIVRRKTSVWGD